MNEFIYPHTHLVAGVDEVGRGPLVGAVVTAAVILGVGRAIGEAMAVIMVAGNQPRMP